MKAKQLGILILIAVVLVGLAVWSSRREKHREASAFQGGKILAGLPVNDVERLTVAGPSGTATVARVDGLWRVPGKFNYPASFTKIRSLLSKLADLEALQPVDASTAQMEELHLLLPGEPGFGSPDHAASTLELTGKNGKRLAVLRLGKTRMRPSPEGAAMPGMPAGYPDGRFVATAADRAFLIADTLDDITAVPKDWVNTEDFLNIDPSTVVSVAVDGTTNGAVRLEKAADGELTMKDIPAGRELDSAKASRLKDALRFLRFDDVVDPALPPAETGLDKPVTYKALTKNGERIEVALGKTEAGGSRRFAKFSVSFDPAAAPKPEPASTNAPAASAEETARKTADAVKALQERIGPWIYLLDTYAAESLSFGSGDLLTVKPAPEKTEPTEPVKDKNPAPTAPAAETEKKP